MRYEIILAPQAEEDLRLLRAHERAAVRDAIERHLRHQPTRISKSRIKRLRGLAHPQYRLRVGEMRAFYDVINDKVEVLAILLKSRVDAWLKQAGEGR